MGRTLFIGVTDMTKEAKRRKANPPEAIDEHLYLFVVFDTKGRERHRAYDTSPNLDNHLLTHIRGILVDHSGWYVDRYMYRLAGSAVALDREMLEPMPGRLT